MQNINKCEKHNAEWYKSDTIYTVYFPFMNWAMIILHTYDLHMFLYACYTSIKKCPKE